MDAPVVTELIQGDLNTRNLKTELNKLLNPDYREKLLNNYEALREKLGNEGASERTAQAIYTSLQNKGITIGANTAVKIPLKIIPKLA